VFTVACTLNHLLKERPTVIRRRSTTFDKLGNDERSQQGSEERQKNHKANDQSNGAHDVPQIAYARQPQRRHRNHESDANWQCGGRA
jgi:hypothetical protein